MAYRRNRMIKKKKSRSVTTRNHTGSLFSIIIGLIFSGMMVYFTYRQTQINEQLKNIAQKNAEFIATERTAPLSAKLMQRATNLLRYFSVEMPSFDWGKIGKGEANGKFYLQSNTKKYLELELKRRHQIEEEVVELDANTFPEVVDEVNIKNMKQKQALLKKFIESNKNGFSIRPEDGRITLAMSVEMYNPRDVSLTITTISYYFGSPQSIKHNHFLSPLIVSEPDIFKMNSSRKLEALFMPFVIPAKERIIVVIAFHTFNNVLEIPWGDEISTKLNAILSSFYYLGIEINGRRIENNVSGLLSESALISKEYPFYLSK